MYHYPGFARVQFFYDDIDVENHEQPKYRYFSDKLIDLFKHVKTINENVVIDLLTCNLNDQSFKDEVTLVEGDVGVNIRYSIDKTGNLPNGNWVLESDNVDVRDIYFNDNINGWNVVLDGDFRLSIVNNDSYPGIFNITDNSGVVTIKLLSDIQISDFIYVDPSDPLYTILNITLNNLSSWGTTNFISLDTNVIFDGDGHTVDFGTLTGINGLFSSNAFSAATKPIIRNLGVLGGSTGEYTGFIVGAYQQFIAVENCYSTGAISGSGSGGIMGLNAGNNGEVTATNCYSTGAISGQSSGGIMGTQAGSGGCSATATNCYSTGAISGDDSGGIMGYSAGFINGEATATNCYSTGAISGNGSGGIMGSYAGFIGKATVKNCYSSGDIMGSFAGFGFDFDANQVFIDSVNKINCVVLNDPNSTNISPFISSANTNNMIYVNGTNNFPILTSFQNLPWIYTSSDPNYYDLYTDAAKFYVLLPTITISKPSVVGFLNGTQQTVSNWITYTDAPNTRTFTITNHVTT